MNKSLLILFFLSVIFSWSCLAQNRHPAVFMVQNEGRLGVSMSLNNNQGGITLPFWLTKTFVVAPIMDFSFFDRNELDLTLGMSTRHYIRVDDISTYLGVRLGSMLLIPYREENAGQTNQRRTDLFAGVMFGIEYFIVSSMSLGMEIQGNYIKSDERSLRFNNAGGMGFAIVPVVMVTFYF